MKTKKLMSALAIAGAVFAAQAMTNDSEANAAGDAARYSVVFVPSWNPETHPHDYPLAHAKHGLLTPIIGATHGAGYDLFEIGAKPTPGLETLSEMGKHEPLDGEIQKAIAAGNAGTLITFADASPGPVHPAVMHEIEVDGSFPLVSLVGMIAPSPDWFYGVSNVKLYDGGRFVPRLVVDAYAHDSGGDSGSTYMAEDADLMSKEPTKRLDNDVFVQNGERVPVGVFIFKRIPSSGMTE